ncbi:Glycosyl transferases group 1 [compost metagenome]
MKLLEAMAAGLPVITTSKGVSGLAVNNAEHYLGSDDGDQLALLITQLLNQPWRMAQLSEAGRQFARQRHDWSVAAQQLENVHMRLHQAQPTDATQLAGGWLGRSAK